MNSIAGKNRYDGCSHERASLISSQCTWIWFLLWMNIQVSVSIWHQGRNRHDLACTQEAVAAALFSLSWTYQSGCELCCLLISVLNSQRHQTCAGNLKQKKKQTTRFAKPARLLVGACAGFVHLVGWLFVFFFVPCFVNLMKRLMLIMCASPCFP